jgi:hypothetical protein
MVKTGLKNEKKVGQILVSGSLALTTKNSFGVHVFSGSVEEDGIVSGKLSRPKYKESELLKSIDTTIIELIPVEAPVLPEMVLKTIYDAALVEIANRDIIITQLNADILDLRAKVTELEIVTQSLIVQIDGKDLVVATAENQTQQANAKVTGTIVELQNSIQKATAESIQRVSLFARNQTLEKQVDQLREELFGKAAKIQEGFKVSDDFAAKVANISDKQYPDLTFRGRAKDDGRGTWVNGPELRIANFTKKPVTITFSQDGAIAGIFNPIPPLTLKPGENKGVKVSTIDKKVDGYKPNAGFGFTGDTEYNGNLILKSEVGTLNLPVALQKQRGNQWGG